MQIADNITDLIGNTPLIRLNTPSQESGAFIIGKCEFLNPTSSVKDRIGYSMIKEALKSGQIDKKSTIIEPTSGNTGIALASICAAMGIRLILTMPESMSIERRKILSALGAKLELTPKERGMNGAIVRAEELCKEIEGAVILGQFSNPANPRIHRETTAIEIYNDTEGKVDIFVAAVGTGGTLTGTAQELKKLIPNLQVVAVEPKASPVLSGGAPAPHKIEGIGAGFIPPILDTEIYDEVIQVADEDAMQTARNLAKREGLLVGISSGANVYAAIEVAKRHPGKRIVTILCDTAERYLSTELFN
jgi:cysteine synthase A